MSKYYSVRPVSDETLPQVYIETYGCQMNVNDSEVVLSVLQKAGYSLCSEMEKADLILVNTCAIRDNAEQRIWGRLDVFRQLKKRKPALTVGILGCMAERLKTELLDHPAVDIVAGPDSYRDLARLVESMRNEGVKQINTMLSAEETYADISPVRMDRNGVSAYISIMRGCNNMCSYCVVPYTRGRERSRDPESILREAAELAENGYREINLLGQNVDSYCWRDEETGKKVTFADLLGMVAEQNPSVRVRFSTSHPKDMGDEVLYVMASHSNICRHIHLPVQSGNDRILEKMNRKYDRATYMQRIESIRKIVPDCAVTTDIIAGFCSETVEEHMDTVSIMREVGYDSAFMFQYSMRPGTKAHRHFADDVPAEEKTRRLNQIIELQCELSAESNRKCIGKVFEVLVEGHSKRSDAELYGRTSQNKVCVFPAEGRKPGDYVSVKVESCTSATLIGKIVE